MAKYTIKGARYLRKYTAARKTPVYAAASDAQAVVDLMCEVPWEAVAADSATMTSHSDEKPEGEEMSGLDQNVINRDEFDAALFCAGHSSGTHRAYANAAVYRYELPDEAVGTSLTSLAARVTSDPYNSAGARLHVFTNSTGEIPMNCHTLRGEDSSGDVVADGTTAAAVAPRTVATVSGTAYWYTTTATATLEPSGGLVLQRYLFLVVALESYSTVRGNWLEGCSYIRNAVELTLSSAVEGWTEGETVDLSGASVERVYEVCSDGVLPALLGECGAAGEIVLQRSGDALPDSSESTDEMLPETAFRTDVTTAGSVVGLRLLYAALYDGRLSGASPASYAARPGASFCVEAASVKRACSPLGHILEVPVWQLRASALVVPFAAPTAFTARRLRLDWSGFSGSATAGTRWRVWLKRGAASYEAPSIVPVGFWLPDGKDVDGFGLLGEIDAAGAATEAVFELSPPLPTLATVMVTGYVSMDGVNPSAASGTTFGCAAEFRPDIALLG